jgi:hypothetical protein
MRIQPKSKCVGADGAFRDWRHVFVGQLPAVTVCIKPVEPVTAGRRHAIGGGHNRRSKENYRKAELRDHWKPPYET